MTMFGHSMIDEHAVVITVHQLVRHTEGAGRGDRSSDHGGTVRRRAARAGRTHRAAAPNKAGAAPTLFHMQTKHAPRPPAPRRRARHAGGADKRNLSTGRGNPHRLAPTPPPQPPIIGILIKAGRSLREALLSSLALWSIQVEHF